MSVVEFLGHRDGLVVESPELRRDIALAIRRHRPDVVVSINRYDSWGRPSWNHADICTRPVTPSSAHLRHGRSEGYLP